MFLLDNPIQAYAWGRPNGLAHLLGTVPTGGPEAELWVGAHPVAPSTVADGPQRGTTLGEAIAADPERLLGPGAGSTLPFLLKVLAIGAPLSLQAHPSADQARDGFAREEAAGLALTDPQRTYRDPHAKPEALVAVTRVRALCGFRHPAESGGLVAEIDDPVLAPLVDALAHPSAPASLRAAVSWLLGLEGAERAEVARAAVEHAPASNDPADPWHWVAQLGAAHPGDPACLAPLLLHLVALEPGDALYLPAGNLHAYLDGIGVEVMGASDNVLRGGLTPKFVDRAELLRILRFEPGVPAAPRAERHGAIVRYEIDDPTFSLARIEPSAVPVALHHTGPSLLLPVGGAATVTLASSEHAVRVGAGQAAFAAPGDVAAVQSTAPVWWATSGGGWPTPAT